MIRNLAIIAHVDHGKTTLVDQMLRQAGAFRANQQVEERVMDSNPLERERGITILAKNTAVRWQGVKINIVDTPGHADFGGEVERILRMVDGVLILVDAAEGPMPQTRFVTRKALALGLRPIVAINKIDRSDAEPLRVHDEVLGLFIDLEATHEQLDAPFLYTSSRAGTATTRAGAAGHRPAAAVPGDPRLRAAAHGRSRGPVPDAGLHARLLDLPRPHRDRPDRAGPRARGRPGGAPAAGRARAGDRRERSSGTGSPGSTPSTGSTGSRWTWPARATSWRCPASRRSRSARRSPRWTRPSGCAGIAVEEPTISVDFIVNNGPFAGREGKYVTSRQLRDRLYRELERNVALRVEETDSPDTHTVAGPRRAPPRHPDGDDAARGLRVPGVAAAGHHQARARRRAAGAVRGAD